MRNRHFLVLDIFLLALVPAVVLSLRFEGLRWQEGYVAVGIAYTLVSLPFRIGVSWAAGLYRCLWAHASIEELERLIIAGVIIALGNMVIGGLLLVPLGIVDLRMPLSALVLDGLLTIGILAAPRLAARFGFPRRSASPEAIRTLVVGAGAAGQLVAREAQRSSRARFAVVGFVDDDASKHGLLLNGIRVEGRIGDLPRLIRDLAAAEVVIAMPSARGALVRRIVEMASLAGVRTRTVPSLTDIVSGRVEVTALRPVEIQDLLRRSPIITDLAKVRTLAAGKVVLVTGAGGSIGSELCRQIADLEPELLVLLDHSENQVFEIDRELRARTPRLRIAPVIADIRDAERILHIFSRYRPFAVFHAAAHKHVPLMEENVIEAVTNNVTGTRNVVEASLEHGVEHFVFISTDKAVRPTSIMGATKRIAEHIVRSAAEQAGRHFVAVRFGNVLGSRGSVVPTFMQQIQQGGPVTVTHPDMRRFFMTIPEAVQLVLQAGALGTGGELFLLDMGEPVRIVDLARDLIRLSGLEEGVDVEIRYTGVRPGEKLYEEVLFGDEDLRSTEHPKVIRALSDVPHTDVAGDIDELIRLARIMPTDDERLRESIVRLVPDFSAPQHDGTIIPIGQRRASGSA